MRNAPPAVLLAACAALAALAVASTASCADTDALSAGAGAEREARLVIETNPGARVHVGSTDATAPCEIPLAPGVHRIRITLRGHHARTEGVLIDRGESRTLIAPLEAKTRGGAIARAALVPGWGSHYMERRSTMWALGAAALAGATTAIVFDRQLADRTDTYNAHYNAYLSAVAPEEIDAERREAEAAFSKAEDSRSSRRGALAALGIVYGLSIAEALLRFPFGDADIAFDETGETFDSGWRVDAKIAFLRWPRGGHRAAAPAESPLAP